MTSPKRADAPARLEIRIGQIPQENLDACARVLARICIQKALEDLGLTALDTGSTIGDNGDNQHKAAPPGVGTPNGAKEKVP